MERNQNFYYIQASKIIHYTALFYDFMDFSTPMHDPGKKIKKRNKPATEMFFITAHDIFY
jgi:hypothetical protein